MAGVRARAFVLAVVVAAAVFALAISASAVPQAPPDPPHSFYGDASSGSGALLNGELAADSSVVTAWNQDGENVGESEIADGAWVIVVWLPVVDPGGNSTVAFTIDGSDPSDAYAVWSGVITAVSLDLTSRPTT